MMTTLLGAIAVALGGLVFAHRRGGLAGLLALLAVLAFAAAGLMPVSTGFAAAAPRTRSVDVVAGAASTAILTAAATAGARARDLTLVLREPGAVLGPGPVGATAVLDVETLPFDPATVTARLLRRPTVDRPCALALTLPAVAGLRTEVIVRDAARELAREIVPAGTAAATEIMFVPAAAGELTVEIEIAVGADVRVVRRGTFAAVPATRVLVLESSGVAAAALRTQGVGVDTAPADVADLSGYAAVVVGVALAPAMQQSLAAAVADGLGVFVLSPAFGNRGEPLHELLPLLPEPVPADGGPLPGPGAPVGDRPPAPSPPAPEPERPPTGEHRDAGPVSPDPVEVDKRAIALVLLVDRSGSMGSRLANGRTPMSYAKTSALQSAGALTAGDRVGIVTFGNKGAGRVELELTDAMQIGRVRDGVEKLAHGMEFTYLLSGLRAAEQLLRPAKAAVKHVVVITDGEFDLSESVALRALANRMAREAKISLTILAITSGQSSGLFARYAKEIATDGGGQFFAVEAAEHVPTFVSAEVTRSLDKIGRKPRGADGDEPSTEPPPGDGPPPDEPPPPDPEPEPEAPPEPEPPAPVPVRAVAASPVLAPTPATDWPSLLRAVPGTAPLDAQVLLVAGDEGWPLLAFGNRGLGRVGAFAADLCGEAGRSWRAAAAFPARLALWVQHVMRAEPLTTEQAVPLLTRIEPRIVVPAEVAALEAAGGSAIAAAAFAATPTSTREVRPLLPNWALGALLVLVLLAAAERLAAIRAPG